MTHKALTPDLEEGFLLPTSILFTRISLLTIQIPVYFLNIYFPYVIRNSNLQCFTIMQPSFSLTLLSLQSTLYPVSNSFLFQNKDTMSALLSRIFCNFAEYVLFSCLKFLLWNFPIVNDFLSPTSTRTWLSLAKSYSSSLGIPGVHLGQNQDLPIFLS